MSVGRLFWVAVARGQDEFIRPMARFRAGNQRRNGSRSACFCSAAPWRPRASLERFSRTFSLNRGDLRGAAPHPSKTFFCPPVQQVGRMSQLRCSVQPRCAPSDARPLRGRQNKFLPPDTPVSPTGRRHGEGHARRADCQRPLEGPKARCHDGKTYQNGSRSPCTG